MPRLLDQLPPREALVEIARDFHARGWMAGSAGNLSARLADDSFWITASGNPKGRLEEDDFVRIGVADGGIRERFRASDRPSAEAVIHAVLYRLFPQARACLHVHTVDACLAADAAPAGAEALALPPLEMIKGFDIWEQQPQVSLPLFENILNVADIAEDIQRRFLVAAPAVTALMIRGHGLTVWGETLQQAYNRLEIAEFLMSYLARRG